jgi:hydrogenase maturation factor HypF (carbamoyltransferase family)
MSDLPYCEKCFNNYDEELDYRFEYPVCKNCVNELNLIPPLPEGAY